jgi:hypothetical protein
LQGQGSGKYNPTGSTTRAEAATICARLLDTEKRVSTAPITEDGRIEGLLWIGDTVTVNGKTYTIERDPATGVIGRGIPTGLWLGYTYPNGYEITVGSMGDMLNGDLYLGQVYEQDRRTGETHYSDDWLMIQRDIGIKIMAQNGGTYPEDGSKYDIWGDKIEEGSDAVPYVICDPDSSKWYGPTPRSL